MLVRRVIMVDVLIGYVNMLTEVVTPVVYSDLRKRLSYLDPFFSFINIPLTVQLNGMLVMSFDKST